ncbi:hypothetical protein ACU8KH_00957 [Lachancea thermotolerans]
MSIARLTNTFSDEKVECSFCDYFGVSGLSSYKQYALQYNRHLIM